MNCAVVPTQAATTPRGTVKKRIRAPTYSSIKTIVPVVADFICTGLSNRPHNTGTPTRSRHGVQRISTLTIPHFPTMALAAIAEIEGALVVQQGKVADNILLDLLRRGLRIDLLQ